MAAAWRSVCGFTCLVASEGQARCAVATCRETSRWSASALRRPPRMLGKTGITRFPTLF